jgi:hypothetical protein
MTSWALFGAFGISLIQSGLAADNLLIGLAGFGIIVVGFVAQVILNHAFGGGFTDGEVALGMTAFGVGLLSFVVSWILNPEFSAADITINLGGFAALIACFGAYLMTRYGLKGAFSMFHQTRHH